MTITKTFTQKYVSNDMEARHWNWEDTDKTYEELTKELAEKWNGWFDAVRIVEKTFDTETFKITIKVIKTTKRVYKNLVWIEGAVEEVEEG